MGEREFTTGEYVGAAIVVLLLAALAITAAGVWDKVWSQEAAGWAQAVGTFVAIVGTAHVARRVQARQERVAASGAELAYTDYLLLTLDLMTQAWATATKLRDREPHSEFLSAMRIEALVLGAALNRLDVSRMRDAHLTEALMVSVSATHILSAALQRTAEPNGFPALQQVRLRQEAAKTVEYLRDCRQRVVDALLVRGVHPLAHSKPGVQAGALSGTD